MVRLVWKRTKTSSAFLPWKVSIQICCAAPCLLEVEIYTALHLLERRMKFNIMSWLVFSAQICVTCLLVFTAIDTALMYFWNIDSSSKVWASGGLSFPHVICQMILQNCAVFSQGKLTISPPIKSEQVRCFLPVCSISASLWLSWIKGILPSFVGLHAVFLGHIRTP